MSSCASKPLVLVTGGAGFIGSNLVRELLGTGRYRVRVLDSLTYAGNLENLADLVENPDLAFQKGDIRDLDDVRTAFAAKPEFVIHAAAESHVDRSLEDAGIFLQTNIEGTRRMLEAARETGVRRFLQVGTDEVYGDLGDSGGFFTETSPLRPSNPYSVSKVAADLLALAYRRSFGLPVVVTRCSNNYGPYQFPEKLIPLMISNALADQALPVYGDGQQVRDWIHVSDHCRGLVLALERGRDGEVYNLGGECERANLEVVRTLLRTLGKPESLIRYVKDRPGHDRRYATDIAKARDELGFAPEQRFESALAETIRWYREHQEWWQRIKSGAYLDFYDRHYRERLATA